MLPPSHAEVFATPADRAACRQAIRQGSRSFHLAGRLLPVEIREPAFAIYAFCRMADDLIDRDAGGAAAIESIRLALDRIYARRPRAGFVERAFTDAVHDFAIPRIVPEALVEGLWWDAGGRRYDTLSELRSYAVRVAGSVGVMMSLVMQRRDPAVLARACDLGVAMQLTNICRDVGEDAAAGRLYLPADLLAEAGLGPADVFAARQASPALRRVVGALLVEAERHYRLASAGIAALPPGARIGINAARLLYREIGRRVEAGVDPLASRAVVSGRRKLALLAAAAVDLPAPDPAAAGAPCAAEAAYLVDAASEAPAPAGGRLPVWWDVPGRAVRMVEMLSSFGTPVAEPIPAPGPGGKP